MKVQNKNRKKGKKIKYNMTEWEWELIYSSENVTDMYANIILHLNTKKKITSV